MNAISFKFSPIKRSAWDFPMFTNSCWRNCKRVCFDVSVISRLIRSISTADGWYLVSRGTGGIMSVLLVNLIVTFFLRSKLKWNQRNAAHILQNQNSGCACSLHKQINQSKREIEEVLRRIWHELEKELGIGRDDSHLSHIMQYFGL